MKGPGPDPRPGLRPWEAAGALLALALGFHFLALRIRTAGPPSGDEGSWIAVAAEFAHGRGFTTRWLECPFLVPYALPRPDDFRYPGLVSLLALAFRAFGIDGVPFAGAVFLQSLVAFAAAIPSSPGFFGPFEAAAVAGLALWSVPKEQAVSFAVGYHLGGFVPVTLAGVYYVWRLGLRWSEVKESGEDPAQLGDGGPHPPIARESV